MSNLKTIVYIQDTCFHCHRQIDWMDQKGYDFTTKEVSDPDHRKEFFQKGGTVTPWTIVTRPDGTVTSVQGFQRQKLEKILEENN